MNLKKSLVLLSINVCINSLFAQENIITREIKLNACSSDSFGFYEDVKIEDEDVRRQVIFNCSVRRQCPDRGHIQNQAPLVQQQLPHQQQAMIEEYRNQVFQTHPIISHKLEYLLGPGLEVIYKNYKIICKVPRY